MTGVPQGIASIMTRPNGQENLCPVFRGFLERARKPWPVATPAAAERPLGLAIVLRVVVLVTPMRRAAFVTTDIVG